MCSWDAFLCMVLTTAGQASCGGRRKTEQQLEHPTTTKFVGDLQSAPNSN